jgi:hypothetical protein
MNRTVRLFPALLLAVAVVLLSVVGSATAAPLITGQQIKDGSITGIDVKDGSLSRADLRAQSRTSVVAASADIGVALASCSDTALAKCPAVRTVKIVPGSQLVTASGTIDNHVAPAPSIANRCGLVQGDVVLAEARFTLAGNGAAGENAHFTLQKVITVPDASQPVSLRCTEMAGEDLRLETADLTSVRTGF